MIKVTPQGNQNIDCQRRDFFLCDVEIVSKQCLRRAFLISVDVLLVAFATLLAMLCPPHATSPVQSQTAAGMANPHSPKRDGSPCESS